MGNNSVERWLQLDKMQLVSMFGSHQMKLKRKGPKKIGHGVRLFLSYAHQDQIVVKRLYSKLVESGFRPWMDIQQLRGGENWRVAIENAIRESDFFVLCLSPNSVGRRGFLQREIRAAMDRLLEFLERDIYFVPVRLLPCERPHEIHKYQTVDLFEPDGYQVLISSINEGVRRRQLDAP